MNTVSNVLGYDGSLPGSTASSWAQGRWQRWHCQDDRWTHTDTHQAGYWLIFSVWLRQKQRNPMALHVSATWRVRSALAWALLLLCCSEAQDSVNEGSEAVIGQSAGRCEEGSCDAKEFYLAACTIFRDEDRYLREWLSFHLCTGIEHFFLYVDRPSTQCFNDILRPYMGAGLVTLQAAHPPPNPQVLASLFAATTCGWLVICIKASRIPCLLQIPTYDHCVRHHGSRARWLAFFDVDEFLFPANRSLVVPDILRK